MNLYKYIPFLTKTFILNIFLVGNLTQGVTKVLNKTLFS